MLAIDPESRSCRVVVAADPSVAPELRQLVETNRHVVILCPLLPEAIEEQLASAAADVLLIDARPPAVLPWLIESSEAPPVPIIAVVEDLDDPLLTEPPGALSAWFTLPQEARGFASLLALARARFRDQREIRRLQSVLTAERETRQHEETLYQTIIQTAIDGFWMMDEEGRCLQVNDAFARMLGYDREEMESLPISQIESSETPEETAARILKVIQNGSDRFETTHRCKDGRVIDVEISTTYLPERHRFVVFSRDITARKSAIDQADALAQLLGHAPASITVHDATGRFLYANRKTFDIHGYSEAEFMALNLHELDVEESEVQIEPRIQQIMEHGEATFQVEHQCKDGTLLPLEVYVRPIVWQGQPALLSVAMDLRERLSILQSLQESEARYRLIIDASPIAISMIRDGVYIFANQIAAERLGYRQPEEVVGVSVEDAILPQDLRLIRKRVHHAIHGQPNPPVELTLKRPDGTTCVIESISVPILLTDGPAILIMGQDLTDRKRAEEERKQLEEQLRQAMKMEAVGRLAGGVAHDFNNILTGISGNIALALLDLSPDHPLHSTLDEIRSSVNNAATLTQQLLTFSRKQVIEPKIIDLNELIAHTHKVLSRLIGEDIELVTRLGAQLGSVKVDPGQFEQILFNLAINARDAMPGGGQLTIQTESLELNASDGYGIEHLRPGRYVRLSIQDTGMGMSEEVREHLFEPFFTTKPMGRGTGLGLATTYGAVIQMGGHIDVQTAIGQGTTFQVYLPVVPETAGAPIRAAVGSLASGQGERILFVEDDPTVRRVTLKVLRRLGYDVVDAANPKEALRVVTESEGPFHLLLTDIVMPGSNGRQLAEQLLHEYPNIKVLFTSGYTEDVIADHGVLEAGLQFLAKPYSLESLARKVREVLDEP